MTDDTETPILNTVGSPSDLRGLPESCLVPLAREVRNFLLHWASQNSGHFAASLGAVELAIALHYVYNTPDDRLVWDVGHQAYVHKILTGRKDRLHSIRKKDGLAPFPKRDESEYDAFGVGHSSTSISAALGMAIAAKHTESKRKAVAIIGDGGITAGMAFEALNHAGGLRSDLLVILNDNEMAISPNVGALSNHFARILSGKFYTSAREQGKRVLAYVPPALELAKRAEEHIKGLVVPGTLFEEFGFNYIGPIDGHDLPVVLKTLQNIHDLKGPRFLHVLTQKGKGYDRAEADPVKYHVVTPFDPSKGMVKSDKPSKITYSEVFGNWVCDMAELDKRLVVITPAMREGSGLVRYEQKNPDRYFDVAIAEQHSVAVAAGMACDGLKSVVAIYSTFLQRAYDQLIHDVAVQDLPVLFAIDRAGVVGSDGATHNGSYDLSFMRCIPNIVIMAPSDENECRQMLYTGFQLDKAAAVRYPRGFGPGVEIQEKMSIIPIGTAEIRRKGKDIAILAFGSMFEPALQVGEELDTTVVNMRFVKPLDTELILRMTETHKLIVTIEENVIMGGAGSAVTETLMKNSITSNVINYGLPDKLLAHGSREDMLEEAGLTKDGLLAFIKNYNNKNNEAVNNIKSA